MRNREYRKIVCVLHSSSNKGTLPLILKSAEYQVILPLTADEAVAFCISNLVVAVVLDSEFLSEVGWSVAETLKALCPKVPILLFVEPHRDGTMPKGIDATANTGETMLAELNRLCDPIGGSVPRG